MYVLPLTKNQFVWRLTGGNGIETRVSREEKKSISYKVSHKFNSPISVGFWFPTGHAEQEVK